MTMFRHVDAAVIHKETGDLRSNPHMQRGSPLRPDPVQVRSPHDRAPTALNEPRGPRAGQSGATTVHLRTADAVMCAAAYRTPPVRVLLEQDDPDDIASQPEQGSRTVACHVNGQDRGPPGLPEPASQTGARREFGADKR
jgi:hypothetical protein